MLKENEKIQKNKYEKLQKVNLDLEETLTNVNVILD